MKRHLALVLAFVLAISLAACSSSKPKETEIADATPEVSAPAAAAASAEVPSGEAVPVQMSYVTWIGCAPLFIAQEKGYFEKYGLDVELVLNDDESTGASMLYANSIQAASYVVDRTVLSYGNGTGQKLACLFDESSGGDGIIASADITGVEDLAGKKVACETASTEFYFLSAVLSDHGMTMDDIELIDMVTATGGAAFIAGEVDAVVAWEPWLSNANQREGGHVLLSSADYPYTIMDALVVSGQFAAEHPEAVDGLVSAWYDAIDYLNANMDECLQIMADGLALTVEDMESMLPGVTFTGREENEALFDKTAETNIYGIAESMLDFWISVGEVKDGTTVDALFR